MNLKENKVDLKKVYHKPLAYFLLGLRLYYIITTENLEDTLNTAVNRKYLSPNLGHFIWEMMAWIITLRTKLHLDAKIHYETLDLTKFTPEEQFHLKYLLKFFEILLKVVEFYFVQRSKNPETAFNLDILIKHYFEKTLNSLKNPEDYQCWFIQVTGYLLYTKDYLDVHRYYYRMLPETFQQGCLTATRDYFETCGNISYWPTDKDFWEKLWIAPAQNGDRDNHFSVHTQWWQTLFIKVLTDCESVKDKKP